MVLHQILLVTSFAKGWGERFDYKVEELDKQIATVDTKGNIENSSEVLNVESVEIVPFAKWSNPNPFLSPFAFLSVIN